MLYGDYNPSGRLPYTIAKDSADYPTNLTLGTWEPNYPIVIPYTEEYVLVAIRVACFLIAYEILSLRLLIDYRWFDAVRRRSSHVDCH